MRTSSVADGMGWQYGDIVRRCLLQPFYLRDFRLETEQMQQKVSEDIVTRLIEDFKTCVHRKRGC